MKYFIFLFLVSCGVDDSSSQAPTASPSSNPDVKNKPSETAAVKQADKSSILDVSSSPTPVASSTPAPTAAPLALGLVTSQPFETNDWVMDLRGKTVSYPGEYYYNGLTTFYRKLPTGIVTCQFRVVINIPASGWGSIDLFYNAPTVNPTGCMAPGQNTLYISFKVSQCQGYSQSTYVCGQTQNVVYDLLVAP